jgi:hypothetical protein
MYRGAFSLLLLCPSGRTELINGRAPIGYRIQFSDGGVATPSIPLRNTRNNRPSSSAPPRRQHHHHHHHHDDGVLAL